jgi:uncharacterized glyoxalase superfamily protein PhnB
MSRLTAFAPQFLVDDLAGAIAFYRDVLGFEFGPVWGGFYAIGARDGLMIHLKEAPKLAGERRHRRDNEHLDAYGEVAGIEAFYRDCVVRGARILQPIQDTPWGKRQFYVEDPEGYIIAFGGNPA